MENRERGNNRMRTEKELKAHLTPAEQRAILLIVENDFKTKEKRTLAQIAEELGISERAFYDWRQKPEFKELLVLTSDSLLMEKRNIVNAQLMKAIEGTSNNGIPSMKALELYYKMTGSIEDKLLITQEVKGQKPSQQSNVEALAKLKETLESR